MVKTQAIEQDMKCLAGSEKPSGFPRPKHTNSRCRIRMRHGRLRAAGFCGVVENRAGRTELPPSLRRRERRTGADLGFLI